MMNMLRNVIILVLKIVILMAIFVKTMNVLLSFPLMKVR